MPKTPKSHPDSDNGYDSSLSHDQPTSTIAEEPIKRKHARKPRVKATTSCKAGGGKENSDKVIGQRVVNSTQAQYETTFKYIEAYCGHYYPDSVDSDGKLILPMVRIHLESFLGDMVAEREDKSCKAITTVTGYCTVIKHYYRKNSIPIDADLAEYFKSFQKGYKRIVAAKKDAGEMKNFEGKVPITFSVFSSLAKLALFASAMRSSFASFVHVFMILCWNLFARSCLVSDLRTHHFNWDNDCMVIDMSKHKGDETGEHIQPKHLYANPYNPEVCVILAMALHVFAISFRMDNDDKSLLFLGSPYDVFTKWLPTALVNIANLGYKVTDIGTHSFRKGIATYCAGFIGGPSVIAIFLRAGWSLGQVQDRYITHSEGADHLCGRVAAGLNFMSGSNFAVLPPHFANSNVLSEEEWNFICPCYSDYPEGFQACLPYFLASLVYHYDWITATDDNGNYVNISADHPIFNSRVVTSGAIERLKEHVIAGVTTGRCEVSGMTATG